MASAHSVNVNIRVRPREVKEWRAAAKRADETLSEWIRGRLNLLAEDPPRLVPVPIAATPDRADVTHGRKARGKRIT